MKLASATPRPTSNTIDSATSTSPAFAQPSSPKSAADAFAGVFQGSTRSVFADLKRRSKAEEDRRKDIAIPKAEQEDREIEADLDFARNAPSGISADQALMPT